jgi:hypothetical protein
MFLFSIDDLSVKRVRKCFNGVQYVRFFDRVTGIPQLQYCLPFRDALPAVPGYGHSHAALGPLLSDFIQSMIVYPMRETKSRKGSGEPPRRKKKSAKPIPDRETAQLFDLMFKLLMQEASSAALVQFINGLFGKSFRPDTKIQRVITEHVIKRKHKLESIRSDCILEAEGKDFMIEVQIGNDRTIALRILEYGMARARKTACSSKDGSLIVLILPDPKVIY